MEAFFHFHLGWRKISAKVGIVWLRNYLNLHKAYIHPGVRFDNFNKLDFVNPNLEKTRKEKSSFKFARNFQAKNLSNVVEVIMIY